MDHSGWRLMFLFISLQIISADPSNDYYYYYNSSSTSSTPFPDSVSLYSLSKGGDYPDTETSCDKLILVGEKRIDLQRGFGNRLQKSFECPKNETVQRCRVIFRGRNFLQKAFKLCCTMRLLLSPFGKNAEVKLTVSSSEQKIELTNTEPLDLYNRYEVCAPPNEELLMVYESDKVCSPELEDGLTGTINVKAHLVSSSSISLVSSRRCGAYTPNRALYSRTGTIYSSYKAEWAEELNFCEGELDLHFYASKVCFSFVQFETKPGGASLQIRSGKKELMFDYFPTNRQTCISVRSGHTVFVRVVPGIGDDGSQLDHTFVVKYRMVKDTTQWYEEENDDYENDKMSRWWIYIIFSIAFLCCTCCGYCCCKRGKDALGNDASVQYRTDAPTIHPAFTNVPRYTGAQQASFPLTVILSVQDTRREREVPVAAVEGQAMGETRYSVQTSNKDSTPGPDSIKPPSYDSLFPQRT